jgi:hypothetical protein
MIHLALVLILCCKLVSCDIIELSTQKINDDLFLDWFLQNGGAINGISVGDCEEQGRGVVATTDVRLDQEVMKIPSKLILSAPNLMSSGDSMNIAITKLFSNDEEAVIASLLLESWRGSDSFFAPYINVLPTYVASLLHFSSEELSELQDPEFEKEAKLFQSNARSSYLNLIDKVASLWSVEATDSVTPEKYLWAASIVNSRGLRFRGKVYLAPFADMFNYAPHPVLREADSGEFFLLHHQLENDKDGPSLKVLADRAQVKGSQLSEDYGDNNDKIYLQYHGFVPSENPFRCVTFNGPSLSNSIFTTTTGSLILEVLSILGLNHNKPPNKCINMSGKLDKSLEVYLTTLSFDEEAAKHCLNIMKNTQKDNKYWIKVMNECGYTDVSNTLQLSTNSEKTFNSYLNICVEPTPEGTDGVITPTEGTVLEKRLLTVNTLKFIQHWIVASSPNYSTTLKEDQDVLQVLNNDETLTEDISGNTLNNITHKILALQYRIYQKELLKKIYHKYDINPNDSLKNKILEKDIFDVKDSVHYVDLKADDKISMGEKISLFNTWFLESQPPVCKIKAVEMDDIRIGKGCICFVDIFV